MHPDNNTRLIIMSGIYFVTLFLFNIPDKCCLKILNDEYHAEVALICSYLLFHIKREDEYHSPSQATGMT